MRKMYEKKLEMRLRKDLSQYFQIPIGQQVGYDVLTNKRLLPDITCKPLQINPVFNHTFVIECKFLKEEGKRGLLSDGFWQCYQYVHHGVFRDFTPDFGVVATEESYSRLKEKEVRLHMQSLLFHNSRKNIGWLDMQHGYPVIWMSKMKGVENDRIKLPPWPLWDAKSGRAIDESQLVIRDGSGRRKPDGSIDLNSIKPNGKIPFED